MKSVLAAITTCRRKPEMVERALKSVVAQTYTDWDLVVVDDSPSDYEFRDDVRKMVEGWSERDSRIRYVPHDKNYGAQRARNTALNIAEDEEYEFIAYLDDDDEWLSEKLEKQIAKFKERDGKTALVYCLMRIINDCHKGNEKIFKKRELYEGMVFDKLILSDFVGSFSDPLIRVQHMVEAGGFDELMPARQDYEAWLRLSKLYKFSFVDEVLVNYFVHDGEHIAFNQKNSAIALERIADKYEKYIKENKNVHASVLAKFFDLYTEIGRYKDAFKALTELLSLKPSKCIRCMKTILKVFLQKNTPGLFCKLKEWKIRYIKNGKSDIY